MKRWRKRKHGARQLHDDAVDPAVMAHAVSPMSVSSDLLRFVNVPEAEVDDHRAGIRAIRWIMAVRRMRADPNARTSSDDPKMSVAEASTKRNKQALRLGLSRVARPVHSPRKGPAAKPVILPDAAPAEAKLR